MELLLLAIKIVHVNNGSLVMIFRDYSLVMQQLKIKKKKKHFSIENSNAIEFFARLSANKK